MIPAAFAIAAQFAPGLLRHLTGSEKAEAVAQQVVDLAIGATGKTDAEAALAELKVNPEAVLAFRKDALDYELSLERLAVENAGQVNQTMQAEGASEHWPTYSWRPAIGFSVAINVTLTGLIVAIAYGGVILLRGDPAVLGYIPAMIGAMAALIGVVSPILGIAAWFRGKMQAEK
ncbi:MAG: hypothetical protein K2W80_04220 [Burkholderiales bacterium]|nr:hypothetical protein [Burkholderiales bacterium]